MGLVRKDNQDSNKHTSDIDRPLVTSKTSNLLLVCQAEGSAL